MVVAVVGLGQRRSPRRSAPATGPTAGGWPRWSWSPPGSRRSPGVVGGRAPTLRRRTRCRRRRTLSVLALVGAWSAWCLPSRRCSPTLVARPAPRRAAAEPRRRAVAAMIELRDVSVRLRRASARPRPGRPDRRGGRARRSSPDAPASASPPCSACVTGLVPRFSGGRLERRRAVRRRKHRAHARRASAPTASGTSARTRSPGSSPTRSRRSSPTAWSSSACRAARCAAGSRRRSTCSASPTCAAATCAPCRAGQQQRVAIGSVLTMHPRLLVLDEPTSALDPTAAEDVLATLTRLVHDARAVGPARRAPARAGGARSPTGSSCSPATAGSWSASPAQVLPHSPVVPPIVELGRAAGWAPLPLTVRDARRRAREPRLPGRAAPRLPAAGGDGPARGTRRHRRPRPHPSPSATSTCACAPARSPR